MDKEKIKLLKEKQDLENEIKELQTKKKDLDFVIEYDRKLQTANAAKQETQRRYKALLKDNNKLLAEIDTILEVDKHEPKNIHIITPTKSAKGEGIANLGAGDWHVEEEVKPSQVQGYNRYNLKIAEERSKKMFHTFLRLVDIERYALTIRKAVINLLGDFMAGYIHDELIESSQITPSEAILFLEDLLYYGLCYLLEKGGFEEIVVICHPGNHSRYTKGKTHYKGRAKKTFEWILYHQLAKLFERKKERRIKFIIPESSIYVNDQFGYKIRTQHGNDFRYLGGIGGESISVNKKLLRWDKKDNAYLDVFGHLHKYTTPANYIIIGSLIGYNEFAMAQGYEYEDPKQAFFLIGEKRGLIVNRPIYLDE